MLIVSFATPLYAEHAERLRASCQRFGYRHWLQALESCPSWEAACNMKPTFIYEAMLASDEPILWLDADAVIERRFFTEGLWGAYDFAIYRDLARGGRHRFRSGTVFFNQTKPAYDLALLWEKHSAQDRKAWDQEHLYNAWEEMQDTIKTHFLDETYCKIIDRGNVEDPHIVHFQASRQLKEKKRA